MTETAITDVRVLADGRLSDVRTVVVADGLITDRLAPGSGATAVDGRGGTLMPGLIDCHAHVSTIAHMQAMADHGVTTVLDMAAPNFDSTMALKNQPGLPTLQSAGRPASGPGSMFITKMGNPASTGVAGPDDAARFVADRVAERSDYLKILIEDPHVPGAKPLADDTVAALVSAAHTAGLRTVAHVVSAATMRTALNANVDIVTHTSVSAEPDDELLALIAARPVTIIPTLVMMDGVVHTIGHKPAFRLLSIVVKDLRMNYRNAKATVAAFHRAGRTILVGTDANDEPNAPFHPPHGASIHDELARLVDAGLTPIEALDGATSRAADTFGLSDRGRIAAGLRADLLLVDGDPTTDIAATRAISGVWIAGDMVRGR
ncbi:MAG TPA: amidohydrolase family protein [Micromonosporaceae bacterium]